MAFGVPIPPLMLPYVPSSVRISVLPSIERRYGVGFMSISEAMHEEESRVCYRIPSPCVRGNKYTIKYTIKYSTKYTVNYAIMYAIARRAPFGSLPGSLPQAPGVSS
jgi:hypothetical protein